jgi:choline transporter-like protein 2/4/5
MTLFFSKLLISGLVSLCAYAVLASGRNIFPNPVNLPFVTIAFVAVETLIIASIYIGIYHTAIDTIFLSVLDDLEKNDGSSSRPYFMTEGMRRVLGKKVILTKQERS